MIQGTDHSKDSKLQNKPKPFNFAFDLSLENVINLKTALSIFLLYHCLDDNNCYIILNNNFVANVVQCHK